MERKTITEIILNKDLWYEMSFVGHKQIGAFYFQWLLKLKYNTPGNVRDILPNAEIPLIR